MSALADEPRPPRLNPFALPSNTDSRFGMLVVSAVGASMVLYWLMYDVLPATGGVRRAQYATCRGMFDPLAVIGEPGEQLERVRQFSDCTRGADLTGAGFMLGGVVLVVLIGGALYWTAPLRKLRKERLQPVVDEDAPQVLAHLTELSRIAGLRAHPRFVWNPLDRSAHASAFGRLGRYYVALSGGLVARFYTDRPLFQAVVLHELAHLRNEDVDRTYASIAVWQAFLVAAVAPVVLTLVLSSSEPLERATVIGRAALLAALVYVMRNAVLRARETYADVRASVWDGPSGALRRAIAATGHPDRTALRRLMAVHPNPTTRAETLEDPAALLRLDTRNAIFAGVVAGIAFSDIEALFELLVPFPWSYVRPLAAGALMAPLLVGVVGLDIWRATIAALVRGSNVGGVARIGLVVGLAFAVGQSVSLGEVFVPFVSDERASTVEGVLVWVRLGWATALGAVLAAFFRWMAAGASTWLELAAIESSPLPIVRVGLALASALLALWLGVLFVLYVVLRWTGAILLTPELWEHVQAASTSTDLPAVASLPTPVDAAWLDIVTPLLVALALVPTLTLVVAWAYPLAPWFWRDRLGTAPRGGWIYLEPADARCQLAVRGGLRVDLATRMGLGGGAVFCALMPLGFAAMRSVETWVLIGQPLVALLSGWSRRRWWCGACGVCAWCTRCMLPRSPPASCLRQHSVCWCGSARHRMA